MPCFNVPGASLHYELTGGGGPALVLVHGGGCTHRDWEEPVRALSGEFTVLTPDLRCHGRSSGALADCTIERWAADVNALVAALGLAPAILVGHSLASRIAAEAAWQNPGNAAGLILLDGSRSVGGLAATAPAVAAATPATAPALEGVIDAIVGPFADAAVRAQVHAALSAHAMDLLTACAAAYEAWDAERADPVFAGLAPTLPILAIQSTYHDKFTPRRYLTGETQSTPYLDFLRAARPGIDVRILPATGHFSMLERPAEISALIRDFAVTLNVQSD